MFQSGSGTQNARHRRRTMAQCQWLYSAPHSPLEGGRYRVELCIDPGFPQVPVSPAFALIPCRVATASEAFLCGTRCALSRRPASRPYPTFAKSQDIGALPPQRRFRVAQHAPPEVDALRRIGSKAGLAPASARRSAASPIRGTALQRLLDPRLAAGNLLDWRSSVPFGGVVCRWRPAPWVRLGPIRLRFRSDSPGVTGTRVFCQAQGAGRRVCARGAFAPPLPCKPAVLAPV